MKKAIIIILSCIVLALTSNAQPPQAFKYQAVVRDNSSNIIANETIDIRISIRDDWSGGTIIYQETHSVATNQFGLITLNIGWGTPVIGYSFLNIDWTYLQKFIEVEVDLTSGGSYTSMGTSQLLSVPYSHHSDGSNDWIRDGNNLYSSNSGDIGIGTNVPNAKLDVSGGTNTAIMGYSSDSYAINGKSSGNGVAGVIGYALSSSSWGILGYNPYGGIGVRGYSSGGFAGFFVGDCYFSENVGIGTSNPSYTLEVDGTTLIGTASKGIRMRNTGTMVDIESLGTGLALNYQTGNNTLMNVTSGNVGIGTSTPNEKLHVHDRIRVGDDPSYSTVYGELIHEGGGTGFKINAHANGGSWADMHLQTNGTTKMFIESSGKIGVGTTSPIRQFQVEATGSVDAILGHSPDGIGVYAISASSYGVFGQSSTYYAGYFSGNVHVTGSLSKGSGSFVIDHPLDPENKLLRHNFVESPENLLIYRGKIQLDNYGKARVNLPDYFKALTLESEATVTLTCIDVPFLTAYKWENNGFVIMGEAGKYVSWVVYADRDDPVIHQLGGPVEEEKGGEKSLCEKGKLLYPEAYGYPESMGRDYEMKQLNKQ